MTVIIVYTHPKMFSLGQFQKAIFNTLRNIKPTKALKLPDRCRFLWAYVYVETKRKGKRETERGREIPAGAR